MIPTRPLRRGLAGLAALLLASSFSAEAGDFTVTADDLQRDATGGWVAPDLPLPPPDASLPAVDPESNSNGLRLLNSLIARGRAQGFEGLLYDNRDRDHSRLSTTLFPRLTHLQYGPQLVEQSADYGLGGLIRYPAITIGNSSTAFTAGPRARSQSRYAMTTPSAAFLSARAYFSNHLYVYPEHRDYDAVDRFPANWPYHVISQGSSRSDKPFLRALVATAAAFPPDTLARMRDAGLVAPTLQMILRRNLSFVSNAEAYKSGPVHRPVLDGKTIRTGRMVAHANGLQPEDIPPLVRLTVEEESFQDTAGLIDMSEKLFTTPTAIARIWRGFGIERSMIVSTAQTQDPNGHELRFTWHLLQGDPGKVTITPLNAAGTLAHITLRWHDPFDLPQPRNQETPPRPSSRVDIGVFAENGRSPSAPALISVTFPTHQQRVYGPDTVRGPGALLEIDYDALGREAAFDPVLYWSAPWRDVARYDVQGALIGWDRTYRAASAAADGAAAEPAETVQVNHPLEGVRYGLETVGRRPVLSDNVPLEDAEETPDSPAEQP